MMRPFFTTTAPTSGFGLVCPRASAASSIARRRWRSSRCVASVSAVKGAPGSKLTRESILPVALAGSAGAGANLRAMRTLPFSPPEAAESGASATDEPEPARWPKLLVAGLFVLILAAALWIRLRHNDYGLPYVYNYDEAEHFTNRAVNMFGGNFDPRYYQNPSAFTYMVYAALRLVFATLPVHLEFGTISQQFRTDPTPIWQLARALIALM